MLREYQESDLKEILDLLYRTVHTSNIKDYTADQINAWAPEKMDEALMNQRFLSTHTYVDIEDDHIVGFGNIGYLGYIDCLYVDPDYQNKGIGTKICDQLESFFKVDLEVHASITAKPFFLKRGYVSIKEQEVECRNEKLVNYIMIKRQSIIDIQGLKTGFDIRKLTINDLNALLHLCQSNHIYFSDHFVMPTKQLIIQSIRNNSEVRKYRDFYSLGFFFQDKLIGVTDLTLDYPIKGNARLNFIILEGSMQHRSIGTNILKAISDYLNEYHFKTMDTILFEKDLNTNIEKFFIQNHFYLTEDKIHHEKENEYRLELVL